MAVLKTAVQKLSTGGGNNGSTDVEIPETGEVKYFYGASGHNCGGRCISKAEVINGTIKRILTDESLYTPDGTYIDPESRNFPQTRSCSRCRSYKYRLYHPGRLLYPLKQTKKRGDLSGFKRITWEQAYNEIAAKHQKVLAKYGVDGIYQIYACGSVSSQFNGSQSGAIGKTNGYVMKAMGGVTTTMFGSYSTHQNTYFGLNYTGMDADIDANLVAKYTHNLVLWGDNSMTTGNNSAWASSKAVEDMKNRGTGASVTFIGPEFVETGMVLADKWIKSKPYTDPALVAVIVYKLLEQTFNLETGELLDNPALDIDYLDTMVYGFFDSPEYWVHNTTGEIVTENPLDDVNYRHVREVPAGESYCSWVLGNNANAKTYAQLGAARNYTASKFGNTKRWAPCSYTVTSGNATKYKTKQDFQKPKNAAWASPITGVSESSIDYLVNIFKDSRPVNSRWSGGQQKQHDGIANLYAVQALHIITKHVGQKGSAFSWHPFTASVLKQESVYDTNFNPATTQVIGKRPIISCTAWHTTIKKCFAGEMAEGGYTHNSIPNYEAGSIDDFYWDDGGTKAMVQWRRNADGSLKEYTDNNGNTFYDWEGRTSTAASDTDTAEGHAAGTPIYAGIRLLYNAGGNIFMNQHENSNDSRDMLESLKLNDGEADTFCLVSIDNFMSATPRYSDYVLPASTFWEQQDIVAPYSSPSFYTEQVILPPGEAKPVWDIGQQLLKTYENAYGGSHYQEVYQEGETIEAVIKGRFEAWKSSSPFADKTWEEYKENPLMPAKPDDFTESTPARKTVMDNYNSANKMLAFIKPNDAAYSVNTNEYYQGGYGNEYANTTTAPQSPKRFQVYSPVLVWQYKNKFSKWHGYLPAEKRGQQHKDHEGDDIVLPLPIYYAYEDYFMEAYGCYNSVNSAEDMNTKYPYLLTTTHDRFRSHSSLAENPILRELSHRVPGVKQNTKNPNAPYTRKEDTFKPANDYGYYATGPSAAFNINEGGEYPKLSKTINDDGTVNSEYKDIASYTEVWLNENTKDASGQQINDGDLVQIENPIGAVRCVARLSKRCRPGFIGLHQGCWYDPREGISPMDSAHTYKSVDVGGNCNTLMASQPSRIDHGNGQQSAMVQIYKINN